HASDLAPPSVRPCRRRPGCACHAARVRRSRRQEWTAQAVGVAVAVPDDSAARLCRACADMGLTAIDLLEEADWPVVAQYGLVCSVGYAGGGSIRDGLNVIANHDAVVKNFEKSIPRAAQLKVPNVITFFGNRRGMPDDQAMANCVAGLERVKKIAEDH